MLVALMLVPIRAGATTSALELPSLPAPTPATIDDLDLHADVDGGECGDEEEQPQELIHCAAEISVFEQPGLLGFLRGAIQQMTPDQCLELLDALYEREMCLGGGRECGDVLPLGLPPVAPKSLSSNSSSASSRFGGVDLLPTGSRVGPRPSNDSIPRPRAVAPPERPPRSTTHG